MNEIISELSISSWVIHAIVILVFFFGMIGLSIWITVYTIPFPTLQKLISILLLLCLTAAALGNFIHRDKDPYMVITAWISIGICMIGWLIFETKPLRSAGKGTGYYKRKNTVDTNAAVPNIILTAFIVNMTILLWISPEKVSIQGFNLYWGIITWMLLILYAIVYVGVIFDTLSGRKSGHSNSVVG